MPDRPYLIIADDEEINREILGACFEDEYTILFAENGLDVIAYLKEGIIPAGLLLDIIMPEMDGLQVLEEMHRRSLVKHYPVFMITAASDTGVLSRAYDLGAEDVISKPFNSKFMHSRVQNIIELYKTRNHLQELVNQQVEKINAFSFRMIASLASVIEFRDGESGEHVRRMSGLTEELLRKIREMYPEYGLDSETIRKATTASLLHDVGKVAIPDSILKKPGKLTAEEYEIMKSHTTLGEELLQSAPDIIESELSEFCYDICRHHHERWDGRGYPDHLKGDEISIWAQAASLADVYDALTSPRVYKKAFTPETALQMIVNGECGQFNPKLIEALKALKNEKEVPPPIPISGLI